MNEGRGLSSLPFLCDLQMWLYRLIWEPSDKTVPGWLICDMYPSWTGQSIFGRPSDRLHVLLVRFLYASCLSIIELSYYSIIVGSLYMPTTKMNV
jgi:hypothetical protein